MEIKGNYNQCVLKDCENDSQWHNSEALNKIYDMNINHVEEVQKIIGPLYSFKYIKTNKNAVDPVKAHGSDSGFDITIIDILKTNGNVTFFNTGIKVQPGSGFYFDLVPRSSISKLGYIMANSIGIIDQSYTGEIIVALIKIDDSKPDLILPCRIAQLIPRSWMNVRGYEVDEFIETERNSGGFGST